MDAPVDVFLDVEWMLGRYTEGRSIQTHVVSVLNAPDVVPALFPPHHSARCV
jgi:hypothetical protein